jgi:hypothetical protein
MAKPPGFDSWAKGPPPPPELERYRERAERIRSGEPLSEPPPIRKTPPRLNPTNGKTHLVIGDSHANPEVPNHRYHWLGKLIAEVRPDVVIDIGDWWDMDSLCAYDEGKKSFEGRRYWRDVDVGIDAQERVAWEIRTLGDNQPKLIRTLGNHENRINKIVEREARFEGIVGTGDLLSKEMGWEEYPFLVPVLQDGIAFCHYFTSGVMGRPISGEHPAHMLLRKQFHSCVQGHTHTFAYAERHDAMGQAKQGLVCGCYLHHEPTYAGPANQMWRRGITVLRNVRDGAFDFEWLSIERIKAAYG